ncbi:hypothetical protein EVAR_73473_1 [Eumeta japonica]|uniref:Myb/SANT-like DNA-binding domain-containing protein n=1 Tax=Eumeta variegata TaxID=151549 RepID=A0A4C1T7Z3_EUMVA|nr:hypothetical protein EVAR_73473_1 [Eumeta japonica]
MVAEVLNRYSARKRSAKQCCNRYENLKKIYTQLKKNPERHVRRNWPYMFLFKEIEEQRETQLGAGTDTSNTNGGSAVFDDSSPLPLQTTRKDALNDVNEGLNNIASALQRPLLIIYCKLMLMASEPMSDSEFNPDDIQLMQTNYNGENAYELLRRTALQYLLVVLIGTMEVGGPRVILKGKTLLTMVEVPIRL